MTESEQLTGALADVRKAFRLLHGYTRRVRDTVAICSQVLSPLEARKMVFSTSVVSERRDPLANWWTWDCLPTVDCTFLFYAAERKKKLDEWMVSISFIADESYELAEEDDPNPDSFAPVEETRSVVQLATFRLTSKTPHDWPRIWNDHEWQDKFDEVQAIGDESMPLMCYRRSLKMDDMVDRQAIEDIVGRFHKESRQALLAL